MQLDYTRKIFGTLLGSVVLGILYPLNTALALTSGTPFGEVDGRPEIFRDLTGSAGQVTGLSFNGPKFSRLQSAFQRGELSLNDFVKLRLGQDSLSKFFGLRPSESHSESNSLQENRGQDLESISMGITLQGFPLCRHGVRATTMADRTVVLTGTLPPRYRNLNTARPTWDDLDQAIEQVRASMPNPVDFYGRTERCLWDTSDALQPAWRVRGISLGQSYEWTSTGNEVFDIRPMGFDAVDGVSRVYASSPAVRKFIDVTLRGLSDDGTLSSQYFTTDPIGASRATSATHQFVFDTADARFAETSVFTHATLMFSFFKELGYQWKKNQTITLVLHDTPSNTTNNAEYLPSSDSSAGGGPKIRIGDGDGEILQNLSLDSEVVSHEFGHHVVFDFLRSTKGPSLTVHEAYADFFTFARNDDPCLAESVCPAAAAAYPRGACWIAGKCLRTADNTLKLDDAIVNTDGHRRGQVVSGLLWDLRSLYGVPKADVTKIAYGSIKFFADAITFKDLIVALMAADKELFLSKYSCTILAAAKGRGFGDSVAGLQCSGPVIGQDGTETGYSDRLTNIQSADEAGGQERRIVCAAIAGRNSGGNNNSQSLGGLWICLLMLPLATAGLKQSGRHRKLTVRSFRKLSSSRSLMKMFIFAACLCGTSPVLAQKDKEESIRAQAQKRGKVRILLSVIWEGYDISAHNIAAIEGLRAQMPEWPITHFISPAYFLHPTFTNEKMALMQRVIKKGDAIALYLQPWKSITEDAGLLFRNRPTFWGAPVNKQECSLDCGRQVPINLYDEREVQAMVDSSLRAMRLRGFETVTGFMAAGWLSSDAVLEGVAAAGIKEDFSPMAPEIVAAKLKGYPLMQWIQATWPGLKPGKEVRIAKMRTGTLRQTAHIPGIIDYLSAEGAVDYAKKILDAAQGKPRGDFVIHLSLIQESAAQYVDRLKQALPAIVSLARDKSVAALNYWDKTPLPNLMAGMDPTAKKPAPTGPVEPRVKTPAH